jgi:hypothetical protein
MTYATKLKVILSKKNMYSEKISRTKNFNGCLETNEELKKILIERDDFYMKQDSVLVDIEDLIR